MRDGVADVLAQRATLDRGASAGIALSVLLHGALAAAVIYAATHTTAPQAATGVQIQFAKMPGPAVVENKPKPVQAPKIEEPKPKLPEPKITEPKIAEPKPAAPEPPKKVEKNTVPFSPFGQSTKKGSEAPPVAKPAPAPPAAGTAPEVPIGASGVTGLEGGDFPYKLYIESMQRRIGTNWFRPKVADGTATDIYFRIQRDGKITDAKVQTSSGNSTFDRTALSAVISSSPLNPLPFAYNGTYLGVKLTFR